MPAGADVMVAVGAGIGALTGFAADRLRGDGDPVVSFGAGPMVTHMTMRSSQVRDPAGEVVGMVVRLSRFLGAR